MLKRIHHGSKQEDKVYLHYYEMIEALMYSAKSLNDTRDNFITLTQSESLMLKERVQHLREQMVDLYIVIAKMIENGDAKNFIKEIDEELRDVANTNKESADLLGQHLHRQAMPGGELSALLHLTNGLNRSHESIVKSVEWLYTK